MNAINDMPQISKPFLESSGELCSGIIAGTCPNPILALARRFASGFRAAALVLVIVAGSAGPSLAMGPVMGPTGAGPGGAFSGWSGSLSAQSETLDPELEALLAEERLEADRMRRRGETRQAMRLISEHLAEDPSDGQSLLIRSAVQFDLNRYDKALLDAQAAIEVFEQSRRSDRASSLAQAQRQELEVLLELGRNVEALERLREGVLDPRRDARDAVLAARTQLGMGLRSEARASYEAGVQSAAAGDWRKLLAVARCQVAVGLYEAAARSLVEADRASSKPYPEGSGGSEPDVLVELGRLYFEVYREVDDDVGNTRSVRAEYDAAIKLHPTHEGALLGQFELHRFNWRRQGRSAGEWLEDLRRSHPDSIDVLVATVSADLDDGQLVRVRSGLKRLEQLAGNRRDVRTELAALAWVEHRRDDARELLEGLHEVDPRDGLPERELGRHLCELYRFAEAVPFLEQSVRRDPSDDRAWTLYGRVLANTGQEEQAREALTRAKDIAGDRRDAWRNNMHLVLDRLANEYVEERSGDFTFVWKQSSAPVLRAYLPDFYSEALESLAERYGFTPGHSRIEVFRKHADFSTRSTGFTGFPATGVCFGPVVTSLSPLSQLRGQFSWARTSFHEYSHVVHLGLSNNRCPRWITEGLATWEERNRNPAWTRNMRRDLLDARANGEIIRVRDLNRAFRGSRILFGYYQGGLLCSMLIEKHGFSPMIRILEAFDRGLDIDQAFDEVFGSSPEEIDAEFLVFVDRELEGLALEPRWSPSRLRRLRLETKGKPPTESSQLAAWKENWITLAWGSFQAGQRLDAEECLRRVRSAAGEDPARALLLRAELAMSLADRKQASALWQQMIDMGHEDYRARMGLGSIAESERELELAREHYLAAEGNFPGFSEQHLSAELRLVRVYSAEGNEQKAMEARERWLDWNAGESEQHLKVADWHLNAGRAARADHFYEAANQVDPFQRSLHLNWGRALMQQGRHTDAAREFEVALNVPAMLDLDVWKARGAVSDAEQEELARRIAGEPGLDSDAKEAEMERLLGMDDPTRALRLEQRAQLLGLMAGAKFELGDAQAARTLSSRALGLDPECQAAKELMERLP